jgi:hypothetical protein
MNDYADFESNHALSIYDEMYYFVTNGYAVDSYREPQVWTINGEQCAPMYFDINPPSDFTPQGAVLNQLLYEVCLSNYGVPLAIGKYYYYTNHAEIFIAYLESTNQELIGNAQVSGRTINQWNNNQVRC